MAKLIIRESRKEILAYYKEQAEAAIAAKGAIGFFTTNDNILSIYRFARWFKNLQITIEGNQLILEEI